MIEQCIEFGRVHFTRMFVDTQNNLINCIEKPDEFISKLLRSNANNQDSI